MSDGEDVYGPDGELLGQAYTAEDGAQVLIDETGEIIAAVDTEGNALDPAGYQMTDDDSGYDEDPVEQQIAELQEWREQIENAPDVDWGAQGAAFSDQRGDEAWALDVGRQIRNEEVRRGRELLPSEQWAVLEEAHGDYTAGGVGEFSDAVDRAGVLKYSPGHGDGPSHIEDRQAYLRQNVADAEREARGENPDSGPAWVEPASSDAGDVRRANLTNAAHGFEVDFTTTNEEDY